MTDVERRDILTQYEPFMLKLVRNCRTLRRHADDALQHLRLGLWRALGRYDASRGRVEPYCFATLRNEAADFRRTQPDAMIRLPLGKFGKTPPPRVGVDPFGFALTAGRDDAEPDDTTARCVEIVGPEAWEFLVEIHRDGAGAIARRDGVTKQAIYHRRDKLIRRIRKGVTT